MFKMFRICKYCNEQEDKQDKPGLLCDICICFVHLTCLRRPGTPGDFACDVFFNFTCQDCSKTNTEIFDRKKFPWVNVLLLSMHHLTSHSYGISNRGYFHYKTHICSFIDRNWNVLFDRTFKQKKNWIGTIAGVLSVYNGLLVCSGSLELKEGGWWMLMHHFSPAVAAHIVQELGKDKPKWRSRNQLQLEPNLFFDKVTEMGYQHLLNKRIESHETEELHVPLIKKIKKSDSDDGSSTSYFDNYSYDMRSDLPLDDCAMDPSYLRNSELDQMGKIYNTFSMATDDTSSILHPYHTYDSDGTNSVPTHEETGVEAPVAVAMPKSVKVEKDKHKPIPVLRENMFCNALNSVDLPWEEQEPETPKDLGLVTEYEEFRLLKKVTELISKTLDPNKKAELRRLRAKLNLRIKKRHKHLPLFDIDKCVEIYSNHLSTNKANKISERVLDRFQSSYLLNNLSGTVLDSMNANVVLPQIPLVHFRSPYSGIMLKPLIRYDCETKPLWIRFQQELINKVTCGRKRYKSSYLQYSYVRPQHIPAVNAFCTHYFWPGIDLTESLQYPEYSCVVIYKKLIVGVAFLVPDVKSETVDVEAYISFVCTRAHWERSKIASFMLYHLMQTCTDRDFTLHVSPSNPAMLLYQKFGFKSEGFIRNFYDRYYDCHYNGCTHAVFMRLTR